MQDGNKIGRYVVGVLLLCLVGVGLRVVWLPQESAWYDELCSLNYLNQPTLSAFLSTPGAIPEDTIQFMKGAPLFFAMQYYWAHLFGTSILVARVLPLLFGILSLPLMALLARRLYGDRAAYVATWCLAISQMHIYYSQETRPYALVLFLALVSMYAFVRGIEGEQRRWWVLHGAANVLLVFSHLFSVPLFFAQFLFLILTRHKQVRLLAAWISAHVVLGCLAAAWVWSVDAESIHRTVTLYHRPTLHDIANAYLVYVGGRLSQLSPEDFLPFRVNLDPLQGLVYVALAAWLGWVALRRRPLDTDARAKTTLRRRETYLLLILWLFAPMALVVGMSYVFKPALHYRYLGYCSFALYLLVGGGVAALRGKRVAVCIVTLLVLLGGYQTLAMARGPFRPDYRRAAALIATEALPDDRVFVLKDLNLMAVRYYWAGASTRLESLGGEQDLFARTLETHNQGRGAWVVMWRWDALDRWERYLNEHGMTFERRALGGMPAFLVYHVPG